MRPSTAARALFPLSAVSILLFLIAPLSVYASPAPSIRSAIIHVRDDAHMHHMHSGQPVTEINETEILKWHSPTPPSYWSIDMEDRDPNASRYPALVALHVLFMSLAFFVALPASMCLLFFSPLIHLPSHQRGVRDRSPFR